jgi:hypothetical protein
MWHVKNRLQNEQKVGNISDVFRYLNSSSVKVNWKCKWKTWGFLRAEFLCSRDWSSYATWEWIPQSTTLSNSLKLRIHFRFIESVRTSAADKDSLEEDCAVASREQFPIILPLSHTMPRTSFVEAKHWKPFQPHPSLYKWKFRTSGMWRRVVWHINVYEESATCTFKVKGGRRAKLTTQLHEVPRSKIVGLYLHSPIRIHGIVLNSLSTKTTLPFH